MDLSGLCKLALTQQLEADNGVPTAHQSCLGVLAMIKGGGCKSYWDETEVYRCREGNQELAEQFAKRLPEGSLRLQSTVKKIRVLKRKVKVTLSKGQVLTADDVILAVPQVYGARLRSSRGCLSPIRDSSGKMLSS
jgi:monoamine oxidase